MPVGRCSCGNTARLGEEKCGACIRAEESAGYDREEALRVSRLAFADGYRWIADLRRLGPGLPLTEDQIETALDLYVSGAEPADAAAYVFRRN